jgi:hypothetical protein
MTEKDQLQLKAQFEKIVYDFTGLGPQDQIDFPYVTYAYHFQKSTSSNHRIGSVESYVKKTPHIILMSLLSSSLLLTACKKADEPAKTEQSHTSLSTDQVLENSMKDQ